MERPRYSLGLFPTEPVPQIVELARWAEELGYHAIYFGDSHLIWREVYVHMAACAMQTRRIKLSTGVTNPYTRHPTVTASAVASLEEAAPGRMLIGLGLGDSSLATMGMKQRRLSEVEQSVELLRSLLRGQTVTLGDAQVRLTFAPGRDIPVYLAASGPKVLELAGKIADGAILLVGTDPRFIEAALSLVRQGAERAGRRLENFRTVAWIPCAIGPRGAKDLVKAHVARILRHPLPRPLDSEDQALVKELDRHYDYYQHMKIEADHSALVPDRLVDRFALAGTLEECRERVRSLWGIGLDELAIVPYGDRREVLRLFAREVMGQA